MTHSSFGSRLRRSSFRPGLRPSSSRSGLRPSRARGATTVEYALLVAIIVAVAIGSWRLLGHRIKCALGFASAQIAADGSGQGTCSESPQANGQGRPVVAP